MVLKTAAGQFAVASIENMVNGSSNTNLKEPLPPNAATVEAGPIELKISSPLPTPDLEPNQSSEPKPKEGPNLCMTCRKRVGLIGFSCWYGNLFCSVHRYLDKHECPFDYRSAAQDAIAKANQLVKADKLDKI